MNKDHLPGFIKIASDTHGKIYKQVETEEIINWCWLHSAYPNANAIYDRCSGKVQQWIKDKGWKTTGTEILDNNLFEGFLAIEKTFFSITYNKAKDKISLSQFSTGYSYKLKGSRLYPYRRNIPLLCFSKHVYAFLQLRKGKRWINQPRIYTGRYYADRLSQYLQTYLNCLDDPLKLYVEYHWMKDQVTQWLTFNYKYNTASQNLMYTLGLNEAYNYLIDWGGKKVPELLRALNYRIEEGVLEENKIDTIETTMKLLRE